MPIALCLRFQATIDQHNVGAYVGNSLKCVEPKGYITTTQSVAAISTADCASIQRCVAQAALQAIILADSDCLQA